MCLALGLAVTACGHLTTETDTEETPVVEVEVGGEAVEVVLPAETVEAIEEALAE